MLDHHVIGLPRVFNLMHCTDYWPRQADFDKIRYYITIY
uniref:Uncharacterized protein n=1 Tax=Lepeophtheirus salmonis TaxID=72036 RepID=A0A0K2T444_LEPSM